MSNQIKEQADQALKCRIAATLVYEARLKDYEAACWLNLESNMEEARANVHSAFDAVLDTTAANVCAVKAQFGVAR